MSITCAIVDCDGTLLDSMPFWDTVAETYVRSLGHTPQPSLNKDVRTLSLQQSARYLQREYGLSLSADEIINGMERTLEHFYLYEVMPKAGAAAFLEQMKRRGISVCIASASCRRLIDAALIRCGLSHLVDAVFTCDEIGYGKNSSEIFRRAMDFFHADRRSAIVLEDSYHAARTAKADGFAVAAVFDDSEKQQTLLKELVDVYLTDFLHTKPFWDYVT